MPNLVAIPTFVSKKPSLKFISRLGVRSLANASLARKFNPLNPPGVGWVLLPQTNMAAVRGRAGSCAAVLGRSCAVVRGRAWSCAVVRAWSVMRGRSCVVVRGHAWSCAVGRAWSCVRGRSFVVVVVRGRSCAVGRAVVPFCPLHGQHCRDTNERTKEGTNERTTSNNPLNPPGVGWVKFFLSY